MPATQEDLWIAVACVVWCSSGSDVYRAVLDGLLAATVYDILSALLWWLSVRFGRGDGKEKA